MGGMVAPNGRNGPSVIAEWLLGMGGMVAWTACIRLVNQTFVWFILVGEWLLGMVVRLHHTTTICHNAFGADNVDVKMQSCVS